MEVFNSEQDYLTELGKRNTLPAGFRCGSVGLEFEPNELADGRRFPMNLSAILLDKPTDSFACVVTKNSFPGAPVLLCRGRLDALYAQGVLVNNKIANVCAPGGVEDAEALLKSFGENQNISAEALFPASTGVIGWKLPLAEMLEAIPRLSSSLDTGTLLDFARGIMTTDAFPKIRSQSLGKGRIVAVAKGAGMIEPNMATLLVFVLTDLSISRTALRRIYSEVIDRTFNCISIDGDQSTSDIALVFSSCQSGAVDEELFRQGLLTVCSQLAEDVVRNGEGTRHVIRVQSKGASSDFAAREIAKAVANSPLVKTAIYGNDPNIGRIIMAIGDYLGNSMIPVNPDRVTVAIGNRRVFFNGRFEITRDMEKQLTEYMASAGLTDQKITYPPHNKTVDIEIQLGMGSGESVVLGSDLSYDYVRENAEYRT